MSSLDEIYWKILFRYKYCSVIIFIYKNRRKNEYGMFSANFENIVISIFYKFEMFSSILMSMVMSNVMGCG